MEIAMTLWNNGLHTQAKNEIALAQDLLAAREGAVLGADTSPEQLLNEWESLPQKNLNNYMYWKNLSEQMPGYRDALIQTGMYARELGKMDEFQRYIEKAHDLDPIFQPVNTLLQEAH
jgi:hypothetical protein